MKLLIGAGGTGGHIIPALAVGLELRKRNWDIAFLGNYSGMEKALVEKHGFKFYPIRVQKLYRKLTWQHIKFPYLLLKSLWDCRSYLNKFKPDAVFCTGGFVSGPLILSAKMLKYQLYLQDGNSFPGLTTRLGAKSAAHVFTATDAAKAYLKSADCLLTGNPILPYQIIDRKTVDWKVFNLSADSRKLLILGGSQGSTVINKAVSANVQNLLDRGIELIWQTGKSSYKNLSEQYSSWPGIHMFDFTDKLNDYYQMADIAIARAGALTIAELREHKIPAIYIPLPTAAENHQYKNAKDQADSGLGVILEQKCLTPESLLTSVENTITQLAQYKQKLSILPPNQATKLIADIIEQETGKNRSRYAGKNA